MKEFKNMEKLGTVVVESDGPGFLVMFPDGNIQAFGTRAKAERAAKKWFHGHTDGVSVGVIEWRLD